MTDEQRIYRRHWEDEWRLNKVMNKLHHPAVIARRAAQFIWILREDEG